MNLKNRAMKRKLLVVSHRPIFGFEILKREVEEVFSDFDIKYIIVKDEANISIPTEYLETHAVYYTADSHFQIVSRTKKYFENIPIARNYPTVTGYEEIEGVEVFDNHIDTKNYFLRKLN